MLNQLIIKNFKESNSQKCMFIFPEDVNHIVYNCPHLIFDKEKIYSIDIYDLPNVFYKEMKDVTISLCSRIINMGKLTTQKMSIFKKNDLYSEEPILFAGKMGVTLTYCMDFQFVYNNTKYEFESFSILNAKKIISILKQNNVLFKDPISIESILYKYNTKELLHKYLQFHYNDLARKYKLDNPRGYVLIMRK